MLYAMQILSLQSNPGSQREGQKREKERERDR